MYISFKEIKVCIACGKVIDGKYWNIRAGNKELELLLRNRPNSYICSEDRCSKEYGSTYNPKNLTDWYIIRCG